MDALSIILIVAMFIGMVVFAAGLISRVRGGSIYQRANVTNGNYQPTRCTLFKETKWWGWLIAFAYSIVAIGCNVGLYFIVRNVDILFLAAVIMFLMIIWMIIPVGFYRYMLWHASVLIFTTRGRAILSVIILEIPVFLTLRSAAMATTGLWSDGLFFTRLCISFPWMLAVFFVFRLLIWYLSFIYVRDKDATDPETRGGAKAAHICATVLKFVTWVTIALILIIGVICGTINAEPGITKPDNPPKQEEVTTPPEEDDKDEPTEEAWATWYCLDPKTEVDEFGPNPFQKDWIKHPEKAWEAFKKDALKDPLIGLTSAVYYNDSKTGKRMLSAYYEEDNIKDDTDAINAALWYYNTGVNRTNGQECQELVGECLDWIEDHHPTHEVLTAKQLKQKYNIKVTDQMYADTRSGVYDETHFEMPNAIIYNCGQGKSTDFYLVTTLRLKNQRKIVEIRHINCRWQGCNHEKVKKLTIHPNPEEPTTSEEPTTKPEEPTTKPEEPTTKPEEPTTNPETNPTKDKKKGTKDKGNDDRSGEGTNNNNGKGATRSKADKPNSSYDESYNGYKNKVKDNANAVKNNKGSGDSVEPSSDGHGDNMDNNGFYINQKTDNPSDVGGVSDNNKGEWY